MPTDDRLLAEDLLLRARNPDARRRAEELAEASPVAGATRAVISATQAAMIATFAGAAGAASGR